MLGTTERDQALPVERPTQRWFTKAVAGERSGYLAAKRVLDIALSLLALTVLFIPFAIISLAVKLTDGGPVLFWQKRVGKDGVEFDFPKFRSMVTDAERIRRELKQKNQHGATGVTFKMRNDPRITPVGAILRKFSLDELPQFWCVLTGEMSLVGPRPALPSEVALYTDYQRQRLAVIPGLTCFWQVQGRANIPFPEQVELDLKYINERTLWLDILLLLKTLPAVILARGAY
jgi:lipopolysaccharide/colanic/teichoic acid biosynthesis glycosyltransferase